MAKNSSSNPSNPGDSSDSGIEGIRATRLQKVEDLKQAGQNPYAYQWQSTHPIAELQAKFADLEAGAEENFEVSVAGRIMARRVFGKLAFFTVQDQTGTIQLYLEKKTIQAEMGDADEQAFNHLKQLTDAGDIIGAKGTIKRTDKGERQISPRDVSMASPAMIRIALSMKPNPS